MSNKKMRIVCLSFGINVLLCSSVAANNSQICTQCNLPQLDSFLQQYCTKHNNTKSLKLDGSCCINTSSSTKTEQIIGVDLSDCKLSKISGLVNNLHNLKVLLLDKNVDLQIEDTDFNGLSHLEYMSLPETLECPGGNNSWRSDDVTDNTRICKDEINLCQQNNITCPNENSECVLVGPGEMECLCLPGYHGYKCLRKVS
ncbi:hypothetical protein ACF0H5_004230 [Mactra antiquata]